MELMEILLHAGQLGLSPKEIPLDTVAVFLADFSRNNPVITSGVLDDLKSSILPVKV